MCDLSGLRGWDPTSALLTTVHTGLVCLLAALPIVSGVGKQVVLNKRVE